MDTRTKARSAIESLTSAQLTELLEKYGLSVFQQMDSRQSAELKASASAVPGLSPLADTAAISPDYSLNEPTNRRVGPELAAALLESPATGTDFARFVLEYQDSKLGDPATTILAIGLAVSLIVLARNTSIRIGGDDKDKRATRTGDRDAAAARTDKHLNNAIAALHDQRGAGQDTFLSYNSSDQELALELATRLSERGISVWCDVWELIPGRRWRESIGHAIDSVKSAIIAIGNDGLGEFTEKEMDVCLAAAKERRFPVIPVLLPGAHGRPEIPNALEPYHGVDLSGGMDRAGIDRVIWGITGKKPEA